MAIFILLAFIAVPIVEIAVFIKIGGQLGVFNTVAMVVITAFIGTWLLRSQGLRTLHRAQESMARNIFPVSEVFDGLCLLAAGAFLLTPGFVTDALGFLLFVPPFRLFLRYWLLIWLSRSGRANIWVDGNANFPGNRPDNSNDVSGTIDGKFHEVDPDDGPDNKRLPPRH
jgi:UPF0716 protein FxsA